MKNVLEVHNLTFGYTKDKLLFEDLSFELQRGDLVAIVGESGAGKSTLFELILENIAPLSGSVQSQRCAEVFQDPYSSFHPSYALINQIKDVAPLDELEKYLQLLNLDKELLEKLPHELSGGQLQRSSILRALLMKPDLLLLDEPSSALDNVIQLDVMKILIENLETMGILLITHDMELAHWSSKKIIQIIR